MKYTINWLEKKTTSTGKNKIDATLQDENGTLTEKVTIWDSYPNFAELAPGREVTGSIEVKQNGQYTNKTLKPEVTHGYKGMQGGQKSVNISKLMDKKAENIEEAQNRKNDSIAYFNSVNSAINAIGEYDTARDLQDYKQAIVELRDWFLSEWHKYSIDPTKGKPPFIN